MKRYVNGKLYEITEEDTVKSKRLFAKNIRPHNNVSDDQKRIKELEDIVAALLAKSNEAEQ